jgi:uncharacterized coiled-coil protein SlyX
MLSFGVIRYLPYRTHCLDMGCCRMAPPLQDRISVLSTKATDSKKPEELEQVMADLRVALHQQANQIRYMVNDFKETISNLAAEPRIERRKLDRRKKERRNKPASSPP